jgi:chromosome segregation ATPase
MDSQRNDGEANAIELLGDELTNELTALDLAATAVSQIGATADDSVVDPNVLALRRVDAEIRQLMESWVGLESQLNNRDAEIRRLSDQGRSVEGDVQATRHELAAARSDCERLRGEGAAQRAQAEEQKRQQHEHREQAERLKQELVAARGRIDELDGELGQARAGGEKLEIQLAEHRDALIGMAAQLRKFEKAGNGHDNEKAALAARIADMDRISAELISHRRDAENAAREAKEQLLAISHRAEGLENELRKAREAASHFEQKLAEKVAAIGSLEIEGREQVKARTELQAEIRKTEKALDLVRREAEAVGATRIGKLRQELKVERDNSSALRKQLKTSEQAINGAAAALESQQQKTEAAAIEREKFLAIIAERDSAMVGLRDRVSALDVERAQLVAQLDELRAQLSAADSEFQAKRKSIAALGTEFNRLGLIQANVRKLDGMMSRQLSGGGLTNGDEERPRNGRLIVSLDGDNALKYPLFKSEMVIGRARDTDIRVAGRHLSRRHARVLIDHGVVMIEDLGSLNGITVNGKTVRKHELHDGDVLNVGGARLRFVDLDEKADATS